MTGSEPAGGELVLGAGARRIRVIHGAIAGAELACLAHVWNCAITRRRGRLLHVSVAVLGAEGAGLALGRGKCPLGPLQQRLGDPVPLFVMWFGPRAARRAVPFFVGITVAGFLLLLLRPQRPTPIPAPTPGK